MNDCDSDPADKMKEGQQLISGSQGDLLAAVRDVMCKCLDVLFGLIVDVSLSDKDVRIKKR